MRRRTRRLGRTLKANIRRLPSKEIVPPRARLCSFLVCVLGLYALAVANAAAQTAPPESTTPPSRLDLSRFFNESDREPTAVGPWTTSLVFEGGCVGCAGSTAPPRNPNAPWTVHSGVNLSRGRSQMAFGVIGRRNHRLAQYLAQPIGTGASTAPPLPPMLALTDVTQGRIEWQFNASLRRTILRTAGGKTVGVVADVFVPLAPGLTAASASTPGMSSRAVRVGLQIGF